MRERGLASESGAASSRLAGSCGSRTIVGAAKADTRGSTGRTTEVSGVGCHLEEKCTQLEDQLTRVLEEAELERLRAVRRKYDDWEE